MQEEIQSAIISVSIKSIEEILEMLKKIGTHKQGNNLKTGVQSIKNLNKHNIQLEVIEMPNESLKKMQIELKKMGVDCSLVKNKDTGAYKVYFKGKDVEQIKSVIENYSKGNLDNEKIVDKIQKIKEELRKNPIKQKLKTKNKER